MAGAKNGRLEAVFALPAHTSPIFDDSVSAGAGISVPAGDYSITSYLAYVLAQVNLVTGNHWTMSVSAGESGTGFVTIDTSDRPFSVTWGTTSYRQWMGFAANISAVSAAQTGTLFCRGLWLPGVPKWTPHGDDDGNGNSAVRNSTLRQSISPTGDVKTLAGSSYYQFSGVKWPMVSRARAKLIGETVTNESFERFWFDCQLGDFALATPGNKFRLYWDADLSTYTTVKLVGMRNFDPVRVIDTWVGRYEVAFPMLVKTT